MAEYNFIDTSGKQGTVTADNPNTALASAPNIAPNSGVQLQSPTVPVASSTLAVGSPVQIPKNDNPLSDVSSAMGGLITSTNKTAQDSQKAVDTGLTDVQNLSKQLEGQTADQLALEANAGLPTMNKELTDLQTLKSQQLGSYMNAYNQAISRKSVGTIKSAEENQVIRQHAVDSLFTDALINAKQGNIISANASVDRALALKYNPLKQALETKKFLVGELKGKAATDAKNAFDLQLKQIEKQEADEKDIQTTIIDAINGGAPSALVAKAQLAKSPAEAAAILGKYSSTALDRKYKKAQIANVYSEIAKRNADTLAAGKKSNFVTPPMYNPQTGKTDPVAQLTAVIDSTGVKDNVKLQDILGVVTATQALAQANPEGTFKGLSPLPRLTPGILKSQEQISNKGNIEAINLKVQQWASGAALTDEQTKQVNKMTPRKGDSDNEVKKKINTLTNFMLSQVTSQLASQGIPYRPQTVDYFGGGLNSLSNDQFLNTLPSTSDSAITNNQSFFDSLAPTQSPNVDASNFVPYTGATADVNLGNMADIKQAIEAAKQDPTSAFATELRKRIESGKMNTELEAAGLPAFQKKPTAVGGIIRDVVRPLAQVASSVQNIGETIVGKPLTTPHNSYLGDVPRIGAKFDSSKGFTPENIEAIKEASKAGVDIGLLFAGGGGAGSAVTTGFTQGLKTGVIQGVKTGAAVGGTGGLSTGLEEGATVGSTLLNTGLGIVAGGVTGGLAGGIPAVTKATAQTVKTASGEIIPKTKDAVVSFLSPKIDDTVKTVLKNTPTQKFDDIVTIAQNAADPKNPSVYEVVAKSMTDATKQIDNQVKSLSQQKSTIINKAKTGLANFSKETGNTILEINRKLKDSDLGKQFINRLKSVKSKLDADKAIDELQNILYTGNKNMTIPAGSLEDKALKSILGKYNSALKSSLPASYTKLNTEIARRLDDLDILNRSLGETVDGVATRGAGLVKQFFSPAGTKTKELFKRIKFTTGIDLGEDAVLAKYLGDAFGDARVRSLLEGTPTSRAGAIEKVIDFTLEKTGANKVLQKAKETGVITKARKLTK